LAAAPVFTSSFYSFYWYYYLQVGNLFMYARKIAQTKRELTNLANSL